MYCLFLIINLNLILKYNLYLKIIQIKNHNHKANEIKKDIVVIRCINKLFKIKKENTIKFIKENNQT